MNKVKEKLLQLKCIIKSKLTLSTTEKWVIFVLGLIGWLLSSWVTHIVVCLAAGKWGFLIAGAILFPIAVVHGTGIWFGVF